MQDAPQNVLSVGQVWQRSRNALAREFRQAVWVFGEIKSLREWRGNWYITLIEPGVNGDGSDLTLDVACTAKRRLVIQSQLSAAGIQLGAGMQVQISGPVTIGRLGKLQLELQTLNSDALIGAFARDRARVIEMLQQEGLLDRNRSLFIAAVPLRVGLVGSDGSDGVKDFLGRLERSDFVFEVVLRHSPVQGPAAPRALAGAITSLANEQVDVVVVVRGGGGELDAFDKEPVVRAIALSPHPVWVGVGHTADSSVADRVAHGSFVTPTACGDALVQRVDAYLSRAVTLLQQIGRHVQQQNLHSRHEVNRAVDSLARHSATWATRHHGELHEYLRHISRSGTFALMQSRTALHGRSTDCAGAVRRLLQSSVSDVAMQRRQLRLLDPQRQLERGYAIARRADGSVIRSGGDVSIDDVIDLQFGRGKIAATVTKVEIEIEEVH